MHSSLWLSACFSDDRCDYQPKLPSPGSTSWFRYCFSWTISDLQGRSKGRLSSLPRVIHLYPLVWISSSSKKDKLLFHLCLPCNMWCQGNRNVPGLGTTQGMVGIPLLALVQIPSKAVSPRSPWLFWQLHRTALHSASLNSLKLFDRGYISNNPKVTFSGTKWRIGICVLQFLLVRCLVFQLLAIIPSLVSNAASSWKLTISEENTFLSLMVPTLKTYSSSWVNICPL